MQGHLTTSVELPVELATPPLHSLLLHFLDSRPQTTEIQTPQYPIHFSKTYVGVMKLAVLQKSPKLEFSHEEGVVKRIITA